MRAALSASRGASQLIPVASVAAAREPIRHLQEAPGLLSACFRRRGPPREDGRHSYGIHVVRLRFVNYHCSRSLHQGVEGGSGGRGGIAATRPTGGRWSLRSFTVWRPGTIRGLMPPRPGRFETGTSLPKKSSTSPASAADLDGLRFEGDLAGELAEVVPGVRTVAETNRRLLPETTPFAVGGRAPAASGSNRRFQLPPRRLQCSRSRSSQVPCQVRRPTGRSC